MGNGPTKEHGENVVKRLVEVTLFTSDVKDTVAFYRDFLGVNPAWESDELAQFELEGVKLLIHVKGSSGPSSGYPPDVDHIAFGVKDVDDACKELRQKGLRPEYGPKDFDWGRSAYFKDPGGRMVELHQITG